MTLRIVKDGNVVLDLDVEVPSAVGLTAEQWASALEGVLVMIGQDHLTGACVCHECLMHRMRKMVMAIKEGALDGVE